MECGLMLISAPAGYGKTTLLSAWLGQLRYDSAWLTLDDGDNDPVRFLAYLAAALRPVDPLSGEIIENIIHTQPLPEADSLLTPLINQLAKSKHPFCLILDDYHAIQNLAVQQVVSFLLEHRPKMLHLVIATRADPPLPLARLRACSEMQEIRLADLRFTSREAADFLNHTMGLKISSADVTRLTTRAEGWIAGLQIAALSIQNTDDVSGFITAFTGTHQNIFDYLLEEILVRQSPEIRRFLLFTSILDRLSPPLCDALLNADLESTPARSSSVVLEELERLNLFIVSLDYERHWYRYHHLFSDLLRPMLEQSYPGLSVELHRRACRWYEAQEMIPEALQHAISSGDMQLVAQIISSNVLVLVENYEIMPTMQKIDSLPQNEMTAYPWLGIARAWALGIGRLQKSQQTLDAVEKSVENVPDSFERQRLNGHLAAARAFVFCAQGDTTNTITHARLANELLPADEIAVRAMNLTRWGDILVDKQKDLSALPILEQALALALQAKKPHVAMIAYAALASANHHAGRMRELHRVCLEALTIADDYQRHYQRSLSVTAEIYSLLARLLAEWGEDEKAMQFARKGLELSERWGEISIEALCLSYLGHILVLDNDWEQAHQVFQRADNSAQKISPYFWQALKIYALDSLLDSDVPNRHEITRQMHYLQESGAHLPSLLTARLALRDKQPDQALLALEQALAELKEQPSYDIVRILGLRALAYQAMGDAKQALVSLQQALELAEPENRVATFVREGAAMERLLRQAQAKSITPAFIQRLLTSFESHRKHKSTSTFVTDVLVEPLSKRELEVLKLLAQGCSDKKIAETLVISLETVYKHNKNIYGKLNVHSRTEAIVRARELDLL
jgi:LuxR family maltose regulon positive regulatory protein